MLKITRRLFLLVTSSFLLLVVLALDAEAQQPTLGPYQPKTETRIVVTPQTEPDKQNKAETPSPSRHKLAEKVIPTIYVGILWKKEPGLPPSFYDDGSPTKQTCDQAFQVFADDRSRSRYYAESSGKVDDSNGYYACTYVLPPVSASLPLNRPLEVTAIIYYLEHEIPETSKGLTWSGASQPLPPGYEYRIINNHRTVTLPAEQPGTRVTFKVDMTLVSSSPLNRPASTRRGQKP